MSQKSTAKRSKKTKKTKNFLSSFNMMCDSSLPDDEKKRENKHKMSWADWLDERISRMFVCVINEHDTAYYMRIIIQLLSYPRPYFINNDDVFQQEKFHELPPLWFQYRKTLSMSRVKKGEKRTNKQRKKISCKCSRKYVKRSKCRKIGNGLKICVVTKWLNRKALWFGFFFVLPMNVEPRKTNTFTVNM